ncbi:vacuolar protein sorting-associated protein 35 [Absidia repens]|uniref:Vacuolar protein sorting-associated protein 35 n=1 Tax=Absidia repens TaxID=90262 RepID=A0A1X2J1X3_9FUNG|nr:vacuolar protein sorting-associated protein 35 [Absidia repens]
MNYTSRPPPSAPSGDQNKLLTHVLEVVRVQSYHMKKCLDDNKLMDGLKYASNMLAELRTSSLTPKTYYQLYMAIFDSLRYLTLYFIEAHQTDKHHMADLYELVQYAGNIVPRLYLMITVGAAYMSMSDAPIREIMRDMMEMTRGVQHPMRGLFLRHYLCGLTRDHFPTDTDIDGPEGGIHESIQFTLTNFIEMNKLWIRLQHQGHSRDREKRDTERRELRILVGTNVERLSQLSGVDLNIYRSAILPELLNECINCRDALAQEYLMDVIIQVFPDDFHLFTLEPFLSATAQLHPKVNIKLIIIALIDRLTAYATRESELEKEMEQQQQQQLDEPISGNRKSDKNTDSDDLNPEDGPSCKETTVDSLHVEEQCDEMDVSQSDNDDGENVVRQNDGDKNQQLIRGIPRNVELFNMFWERIIILVKARPDLTIEDITELLVSLINLCLSCYPDKLEYVDQILAYCKEQCAEHLNTKELTSKSTGSHLMTLLSAPIRKYESPLTLLMLQNYGPLLRQQPYNARHHLALDIVKTILEKGTVINTPEDVHNILELCDVLIRDQDDHTSTMSTVHDTHRGRLPSKSPVGHHYTYSSYDYNDEDSLLQEQGLIAKLIQLLQSDEDDTQFLLLSVVRRQIGEGGKRIRYTFPSLISAVLKLSSRYQLHDRKDDIWEKKTSTLYRFIHQVINILYTTCDEAADHCLRFYLMAGQCASHSGFEDLSYDFFVEALKVYEESISDSKAQFQAIVCLIGALRQTNGLSQDNYDTLIIKAALHGSKLLKKPDQCRGVYLASHLWWEKNDMDGRQQDRKKNDMDYRQQGRKKDDMDDQQQGRKEDDMNGQQQDSNYDEQESSTNNTSNSNNKRILECLQKALKIADSCMDMVTSLELFVEILNQCIYYYDKGNGAITAKYIIGLIDMIQSQLSDLDETDLYPFTSSSSSLLQHEGSSAATHVRQYFAATLKLLKSRQDREIEHGGSKYGDIPITLD